MKRQECYEAWRGLVAGLRTLADAFILAAETTDEERMAQEGFGLYDLAVTLEVEYLSPEASGLGATP